MYFKDKIEDIKETINFKQLLIPAIILLVFIVGIILIFIGNNGNNNYSYDEENYYINLLGNKAMTIYVGSEYIEPGYNASNSKGEDLTKEVFVDNQVNTNIIGNYTIKYIIKNTIVEREINVIEKPISATIIYLIGDLTMYLNIGEKYVEPGYEVVDTIDGGSLKNKVIVDNNININKAGVYKVIYTVTNSAGVTTSKKRTVIIMDSEISLTLDTDYYTNKDENINIYVNDPYFDYIVLPNGSKIFEQSYIYKITENGKYKFDVYNQKGIHKEATITVNNINKTIPVGSCSGEYKNGNSIINISANDDIGISKYVINGKTYTKVPITINNEIENVNVSIYDNAGNSSQISCNLQDNNPVIINGSCSGSYQNGISTININASSNRGISKYVINGTSYTTNNITIQKELKSVKVTIYDNKNNSKDITCNLDDKNVYGNLKNISSKTPIEKYKNVYLSYYTSGSKSFSFWVYLPEKIRSNLPIILFMGGTGEKGNDYINNSKAALNLGPIHEVVEFNYKYDAIIVHVQVPGNSDVYPYLPTYIELLNRIASEFKANTKKISIMGFSHGCYGVMNIMNDHRKYFSAAVPIGCEPKNRASYFIYTPTWAFAGAGEGTTSFPGFVEQINNMGGYAKFTQPPEPKHNVLNNGYSILRDKNYNVIEWMISQTRN